MVVTIIMLTARIIEMLMLMTGKDDGNNDLDGTDTLHTDDDCDNGYVGHGGCGGDDGDDTDSLVMIRMVLTMLLMLTMMVRRTTKMNM